MACPSASVVGAACGTATELGDHRLRVPAHLSGRPAATGRGSATRKAEPVYDETERKRLGQPV